MTRLFEKKENGVMISWVPQTRTIHPIITAQRMEIFTTPPDPILV
jgi:hypothetical protein